MLKMNAGLMNYSVQPCLFFRAHLDREHGLVA